MKWNVFLGGALLAWMFLLFLGAPLLPVVAGTGVVALWNLLRKAR